MANHPIIRIYVKGKKEPEIFENGEALEFIKQKLDNKFQQIRGFAQRVWDGASPFDKAAIATAPLPIIGDLTGLAADVNTYIKDPESRNILNFGMTAAGLLPFVPALSTVKKVGEKLSPSQINKKAFDSAYDAGKKAKIRQTENGGSVYDYTPQWIYGDSPDNVMDNARLRNEAFELGVAGNYPRIVKAKRIGEIPEKGFSTNFTDNSNESGVSVLGTYKGDNYVPQNDKTFKMFNDGKEIEIEGMLHPTKTGSDGEPLLLMPTINKLFKNVNE